MPEINPSKRPKKSPSKLASKKLSKLRSGAKTAAAKQPKKPSSPAPKKPVNKPLPAKSLERAGKAFKNFTLSKFGKNPPPSNHVGTATRTPAFRKKTAKAMNDIIASSFIDNRGGSPTTPPLTPNPNNLGMSVSFPLVENVKKTLPGLKNILPSVKKILPSYNPDAGTVDLDEFVDFLEKKRNGSEFYTKGNLTLGRISVQNKVQAIISQIANPIKK